MRNKYSISAGLVESGRKIEPQGVGDLLLCNKLCFGFTYFREAENFGLKTRGKPISNRWMISFVSKLRELGKYSKDELDDNRVLRDRLRHHKVDWHARNIPISREDFSWLPHEYQNDDDYPFWQFQLSSGTGRFLGFYDECYVFQIVYIDPLHNAQPSGNYAYKVDTCSPLRTELDYVIACLHEVYSNCRLFCSCNNYTDIDKILSGEKGVGCPIIAFGLSEDAYLEFRTFEQNCLKAELPIELVDVFIKGMQVCRDELLEEKKENI